MSEVVTREAPPKKEMMAVSFTLLSPMHARSFNHALTTHINALEKANAKWKKAIQRKDPDSGMLAMSIAEHEIVIEQLTALQASVKPVIDSINKTGAFPK